MNTRNEKLTTEEEQHMKAMDKQTFWLRVATLMLMIIGLLLGWNSLFLSSITDQLKSMNTTVTDIEKNQAVAANERENIRKDQADLKIAYDDHSKEDDKRFNKIENYLDLTPSFSNKATRK